MCKRNGAHLANYKSSAEQVGACLPACQNFFSLAPSGDSHQQRQACISTSSADKCATSHTTHIHSQRAHAPRTPAFPTCACACLLPVRWTWRTSSSAPTTSSEAACRATGTACTPSVASPGSTGLSSSCPALEVRTMSTGASTTGPTPQSPATSPTPQAGSAAAACSTRAMRTVVHGAGPTGTALRRVSPSARSAVSCGTALLAHLHACTLARLRMPCWLDCM